MKIHRRKCKLMGTAFELGVVTSDPNKAKELLDFGVTEIQDIEALFTEFEPESTTSQVNRNAGIRPVSVPKEFLQLLQRCLQISSLTKGYFDITVGNLKQLYQFKNAAFSFPERNIIKHTLENVGFDKIILDIEKSSVFLSKKEMKISFAAIGKGYAADSVKRKWQAKGVAAGYINASGDLIAFGNNADEEPWKIGIANPDNRDEVLFYIPLQNAAAATSGDYEQHFLYKGIRYSHNISPKTGLPISGIKSVTVFSPSAELSDALATAIYAMGRTEGLRFVQNLPQTHALIIDDKNQVFFSENLEYEAV